MSKLNKAMPITIVGGSLIGPTVALQLRHYGFENVTVLDAGPSTRKATGGILGLRENSLKTMETIGVDREELRALEVTGFSGQTVNHRQVVSRSPLSTNGWEGAATTWDLMNEAVAKRVPIQYKEKVTEIRDGHVITASGSEIRSELVIFADGRRSTGRRIVAPERSGRYVGYIVWRGMVPSAAMPDDGPDTGVMWVSDPAKPSLFSISGEIIHGRSKGMHDWTSYQNITADQFREIFGSEPTEKALILPQGMSDAALSTMKTHMHDVMPEWINSVSDYSASIRDVMAVSMVDYPVPTQAAYKYGGTNVVLLGDALQTVRPHTGQGTNNGIEQGMHLAEYLDSAQQWGQGIETALSGWEPGVIAPLAMWQADGANIANDYGLGNVPRSEPTFRELLRLFSAADGDDE